MLKLPPNPFRESRLNDSGNYRPEWDVPELNAAVSNWLVEEVRRLAGRDRPDPGQMIAVITGPPGYGKTHLFGRIEHQVGRDVFFVFVPAFEPETPPLDHIRRHVVAALFRKVGDAPSPVELALARLCGPALADYFADLPPTLAARHDSLRQRLAGSPDAVLEVVRPVKALPPFARLADSLVSVLPGDAGVIRALALGWAPPPWSDTSRRWLQGQDLPEGDLKAVGLTPDPPTALAVLKAIPALFGHQQPMMICCDQVEGLLRSEKKADLLANLSGSLMDLLQGLPVQVVLSCFKDSWQDHIVRNTLNAFQMRVRQPIFDLEAMKPNQGIRLIAGRMTSWPEHPADKPPTWPFAEAAVRHVVARRAPTPRALIQDCARQFDEWCEGDQAVEIAPPPTPDPKPGTKDLTRPFLAEWASEIEEIKSSPERAVGRLAEDRFYRGVLEALKLAHSAQRLRDFGGARVVDIQNKVIKATAPLQRPGAAVSLVGGPGESAQNVLVALTTIESTQSFAAYFRALIAASGATKAVGILLIHPRRDLNLGHSAKTWMELEQKMGRFRLLALEDHPLTFQALEAFVALLIQAENRELVLDGVTMTPEDCRDLVIKTGVIDNIDLFKLLGHAKKAAGASAAQATAGANGAAAAAPGASPVPAVAMAPAASGRPTSTAAAISPAAKAPAPAAQPVAPARPKVDHSAWAEDKLAKAVKKLKLLGQDVQPGGVEIGPTFARLRVEPLGKTNFKGVSNKAVDLRISLGLERVPIVGSQAGCISIDVQRPDRATVGLAEALGGEPPGLAGAPSFPVGQDVGGQAHWLDLAEPSDCHLLVAGTTGSGKSEFLRAAVAALARRLGPGQVQFLLIDPKRVTFNIANASPYLRAPVAHSLDEALPLIQGVMDEMDRRYAILAEQGISNVGELDPRMVPRVVVVIDEFASFLEEKESKKLVTALLKRIGAMARAAGIHLIVATQRPDKDVITPVLRENLPGRIALQVTNKAGSDLILGAPEAEHLLGKGDLLWKRGGDLLRLQSPFVTQAELEAALRVG